jgi:hypothetical protein
LVKGREAFLCERPGKGDLHSTAPGVALGNLIDYGERVWFSATVEDNLVKFPKESYFCCGCGKQMTGKICVFTCRVNGHLGSMIYCQTCLDAEKEKEKNA